MPKPFNFASIPGCVLWVQTTADPASPVVNKLRELTGKPGDVFVWPDPNDPDNAGIIVAYDRELSQEERAVVEAQLIEATQPPMADLPTH